ncbi:MAG: M50 family metallopeptidase [Planctomycetota bacterium]|nr:M50 family metallopeptidase [Planctomycetota bacterium]
MPTSGFRLFKLFGITVYLHWSWLVIALYEIQSRKGEYSSILWNIAEYLALFLIVLMHEFGHALACISVGGKAMRIVLWPLGGVAYVDPPPRPGAMLWSIVAGPLVNVALLPVTLPFFIFHGQSDFRQFLWMLGAINLTLLVFNLLPIYPLDGGKILQSLLWFVMGRARSLLVATSIGMVGAVAGGILALWTGDSWLGILALFAAFNAYSGFKYARQLKQREAVARRAGFYCPACGSSPPMGPLWVCTCGKNFDTFETQASCPACGRTFQTTRCADCGNSAPITAWGIPRQPVIIPPPPSAIV